MAPAGRPKLGKEKRVRVNLMLDPVTHAYIRKVGGGNASAGINWIVQRHKAGQLLGSRELMPKPKKSQSNQS